MVASTSAWLLPSYMVRFHASARTVQTHRIRGAWVNFNARVDTAQLGFPPLRVNHDDAKGLLIRGGRRQPAGLQHLRQ